MRLSSYHKILTGFALVMAAAAVLAATALGWLYFIDQQLDSIAAAAATSAVRTMVRQGYWLIVSVGAVGTMISCGCLWWVWSTLGRVLRNVGCALQESSGHVLGSVDALSHESQQLAGNARRAAATIGETTSDIEELSGITIRNAERAGGVKQLAGDARVAVDASAGEIQALSRAMQEIAASGAEVERIIHVMHEIAFQTNLLALNAAVEAAHAGEKGQGFAVVASEVHALAKRSSDSAREIADRVQVVGEKTRHGVDLVGRATSRLQQVVGCNQKLEILATEVAADSSEQEGRIKHLRTACDQLKAVTQGNAQTSENAASATDDLRTETCNLREAVITLRNLVEGENPSGATTDQRRADPVPPVERPLRPVLAQP